MLYGNITLLGVVVDHLCPAVSSYHPHLPPPPPRSKLSDIVIQQALCSVGLLLWRMAEYHTYYCDVWLSTTHTIVMYGWVSHIVLWHMAEYHTYYCDVWLSITHSIVTYGWVSHIVLWLLMVLLQMLMNAACPGPVRTMPTVSTLMAVITVYAKLATARIRPLYVKVICTIFLNLTFRPALYYEKYCYI